MEAYSIHVVEQLTGVKAHTLRVWEKRYQSLIPHRTATNIRYYDGLQLRKLLNISSLQRGGHKIAALMAMNDDQLNGHVLDLAARSGPEDVSGVYVNELISHMLAFDEQSFDKTCSSVIIRFGMQEAVLKVIFPFLNRTGALWSTNNAVPAHEHFASNIIKRKLLTAIDGIPISGESKRKYILFLPPDEWHELGLLLADFLLRRSGHASIYLGQSLPFESLEQAVKETQPSHLLTFFTTGIDKADHFNSLSLLAEKYPHLTVLVGSMTIAGNDQQHLTLLRSPADVLKQI